MRNRKRHTIVRTEREHSKKTDSE